jgi:hypothetical protein
MSGVSRQLGRASPHLRLAVIAVRDHVLAVYIPVAPFLFLNCPIVVEREQESFFRRM